MYSWTIDNIAVVKWGFIILVSLGAAIVDIRRRRLPNVLTMPMLIVGLALAVWENGLAGFGNSVGGCIILSLPYIILFLIAGGGAGDAKMMAAIGSWVGIKDGLTVLVFVSLAAIIQGLIKSIIQKRLKIMLKNIYHTVLTFLLLLISGGNNKKVLSPIIEKSSVDITMPYGIAIFAGVACAGGYCLWIQK